MGFMAPICCIWAIWFICCGIIPPCIKLLVNTFNKPSTFVDMQAIMLMVITGIYGGTLFWCPRDEGKTAGYRIVKEKH
eukprot:2203098-Amphidinium_carterae.1